MTNGKLLGAIALACCAALGATAAPSDGAVMKQRLEAGRMGGANLLREDGWRPLESGFTREGGVFLCDNAADAQARRGASQTVQLNQQTPQPIIAEVWSKAAGVGGTRSSDYALYLDLQYADGTPLWGQTHAFNTGAHDWERGEVLIFPAKPVKSVTVNLLLRRHSGRAWFRDPQLRVLTADQGTCLFDGVAVAVKQRAAGFQVRDAAANSDFVALERQALGVTLTVDEKKDAHGAAFFDVTLRDTSGRDRAVTLLYTVPLEGAGWRWLGDPQAPTPVAAGSEYANAARFQAGANGRLSRYPLGAAATVDRGIALGIDMARPAFFRVCCNGGARELFLACDIGLTPEKPTAHIRFCRFEFEPKWGFRAALARYYQLFPEAFRVRIERQGLWMPFAKISAVEGWEDFGFAIKEGNNETAWDDAHGIATFRYTEPHTWWMRMAPELPRTLEAALAEARRLAQAGDARARAFLASAYHDERGQIPGLIRNAPWCDGIVWSVNSAPGVAGEFTDFKNKWNAKLRESLYGPKRKGDLDGEYVDSSEGYVTAQLNFRRAHFAAMQTPLTFSTADRQPAIFRGSTAFEYVRGIERDMHGAGKLMMANGTPGALCWLAPLLDVTGSETDWNRGGQWRPLSRADLLHRRALSKGKPYCFLMNTEFERFPPALVEKYMKRCLAFGMFPGFFSHNASQKQYFTQPALYNRDRPLFKKYVPLCRRVAEAGWEPLTLARSSDPQVWLERFGENYLTVFNGAGERRTVQITLDGLAAQSASDLVSGRNVELRQGELALELEAEDIAVLELQR